MAPRVAVLHHPRSIFPLELFNQVGDAAELLWVLDEAQGADPELVRLLRHLGVVVVLPTDDLDAATRTLARYRPEGIVSYVDDHVVLAAELAERLSLPYHTPEVARMLVDKRLQRAALDAAGVPGPPFWPVAEGMDRAGRAQLAANVEFPVVVKPAEGSGSAGIELLAGPDDLEAYLERNGTDRGYLLEGYLEDESPSERGFAGYFSVESVVCNGRASHVALTGRFPLAPPFRESGNFVPALLPRATESEALAITDAAIEALGIDSAVIHTELKPTPKGLALIEVNGRLGGRPPYVLKTVSDVNLFRATCQLAVGRRVVFPGPVPCDGVGYWLMLQPPTDAVRVKAVSGVDAVTRLRGVENVSVVRTPGEPVDWRLGTHSRVAAVRGRVADHDELSATIAEIRRCLVIRYLTAEDDVEPVSVLEGAEIFQESGGNTLGVGAVGA